MRRRARHSCSLGARRRPAMAWSIRGCRGLGAAATATSGRCAVGGGHAAGLRARRGDRQRTARQPSVSTRCLRRGLARGGRVARAQFRVGRKHHCTRPGMVMVADRCRHTAHGCPCRATASSWVSAAQELIRQGTVMAFDYCTRYERRADWSPLAGVAAHLSQQRPRRALPSQPRLTGHHRAGVHRPVADTVDHRIASTTSCGDSVSTNSSRKADVPGSRRQRVPT